MRQLKVTQSITQRTLTIDKYLQEIGREPLISVDEEVDLAQRIHQGDSRALDTLTDREGEIIKMFFGIGGHEMTLEEIGDQFGLTRERVRQIKEKAIRRLRSEARSGMLRSYLG